MMFESKRGPKKKNKEKNVFCKLESLFFFLLFFHYSFPLHFKDDLYSLRLQSHNISNHSKWSTYDEDIKN
jgi:hypothetical protein